MSSRTAILAGTGLLRLVIMGWVLVKQHPKSQIPFQLTAAIAPPVRGSVTPESFPSRDNENFSGILKARLSSWVESRGRDAGSLVAVWDLTGDAAFLEEACKLYPENPMVCAAIVQERLGKGLTGEDTWKWIQQLIKLDPENPLGNCYMGVLANGEKDLAGVTAAIELALKQTNPPNSYLGERLITARDGALAAGASPGEAARIVLKSALLEHGGGLNVHPAGGIYHKNIIKLQEAGLHEEMQAAAEQGFLAYAQMGHLKSQTWGQWVFTASGRQSMLERMNPDTEIGDTGLSAAEMIVEEKRQMKLFFRRMENAMSMLETGHHDAHAAYLEDFILHGQPTAIEQLLSNSEKK